MATLSQILSRRWPGAEWTIAGDDYASLAWLSPGDPPAEAEIRALSAEVDQELQRSQMVVTPMQFRLALEAAGLLDECEAAVAAAPRVVQIRWEYAVAVERLNPFIDQFAQQIGKTPEEVDALFDAAALIRG
jgi:hypothetical protein